MKEFWKNVVSTVVGVALTICLFFLVCFIGLCGLIASAASDEQVEVKDGSVLVLKLSGMMEERAQEDIGALTQFVGAAGSQLGLDTTLAAIHNAKVNKKIKGIYIEAGMFGADSPATVTALRDALADFRKSGKWIVAYADSYTQSTYYICSVADKVWLNPQGVIDWHGMAAQPYFLKDMLAKFGVKVQLSKVGKYKSAPEMLTADGMSEPNREQTAAYIGGIWEKMTAGVAASRKISQSQVNAYADSLIMTADPADYVKMKLIDRLLYTDEVKVEIKKLLGLKADDKIPQLSLSDMSGVPDEAGKDGGEIAVYYCVGDVMETNPGGLGNGSCIAADDVCRDLEELREDDDVKAVVLRVNSGGGSAYASEQIWRQVKLLGAKKPVVASMGGMAASGAYYLSCPASYIFAEPTTLTGSIGIFGMFPDFSGLLTEKLGVKFDVVKTNKHADFGTVSRPFSEEEMAYLNTYIERGYRLFRSRVADGRRLKTEQVEAIAQGRVWLGRDALGIRLIDKLGSLDDAIAKAAALAKQSKWHTETYPAPPSLIDQLLGSVMDSRDNYLDEQLRATLGEYYSPFMLIRTLDRQSAIQARMPFVLRMNDRQVWK